MNNYNNFSEFLNNIKVDNYEVISHRYKEITKKLNRTFRDSDSDTSNCKQVGSYGRHTGIKGISDLDMLYVMPDNLWDNYKNSPSKLLSDVKEAIKSLYPKTDITFDRLVVDVKFSNFTFEVQPVFKVEDDEEGYVNYKYPDTKSNSYKITKPNQEQDAMTEIKNEYGECHRHLCKMMREWKDNAGVSMGGLLVDTLAYNFILSRTDLVNYSYSTYDTMVRDFLGYLKDQPKQDHYQAIGSNQDVKVKNPFRTKAKTFYSFAQKACYEDDEQKSSELWVQVFGKKIPKSEYLSNSTKSYSDNEEFIEDIYNVNITNNLTIECEISANGFRNSLLSDFISKNRRIPKRHKLSFFIKHTDVVGKRDIKWKVKNCGEEAKKRNCLRGQIISSNKGQQRIEFSDFYGDHYVECYIIQNNIVVAKDRIVVQIED